MLCVDMYHASIYEEALLQQDAMRRSNQSMPIYRLRIALPFALLLMLLLAACGGWSSTPAKPSPTPSLAPEQGAQLLAKAAQAVNGGTTAPAISAPALVGPSFNRSLT